MSTRKPETVAPVEPGDKSPVTAKTPAVAPAAGKSTPSPAAGTKTAAARRTSRLSFLTALPFLVFIVALVASSLLASGNPAAPCSGSYLILTAHPDDEAMFFAPTVLGLVRAGCPVRALCLSTGNEKGLGDKRKAELLASYEALGVPRDHVEVLDHVELQDGFIKDWPVFIIDTIVGSYVSSYDIDTVITFDHDGVSEHPNHLAVSRVTLPPKTTLWRLRTPALLAKYTGPFSIVKHYLSPPTPPKPYTGKHAIRTSRSRSVKDAKVEKREVVKRVEVFVASPVMWCWGVVAMLKHKTQLVWFRWLYLGASKLMWINELNVVAP